MARVDPRRGLLTSLWLGGALLGCTPITAPPDASKRAGPGTLPVASALEDQLTQGQSPAGLAAPDANPRHLEGVWLPFRASAPSGGPPPTGAGNDPHPTVTGGLPPPPDRGVFGGDENAPWSVQMCAPYPVFGDSFNFQIVQAANEILLIGEDAQYARIIRLDAAHPAHPVYKRNGDSTGRWDGNVLVVDTIGVARQGGAPSAAHVVERIYKTDAGRTLHLDMVLTEPGHATVTSRTTARWRPDLHLAESVCEEGFSHFKLNNGKLVIDNNGGA